jgi:Ser/Thr protein kinase RdoA (MazF antagonist)
MVNFANLTTDEQIACLAAHAKEVLLAYDLGAIDSVESINHEFNSTFAVVTDRGSRFALRINVNSSRTLEYAKSEVDFINHLALTTNLSLPRPVADRSGQFVIILANETVGKELISILFTWLEGSELGDEPPPKQVFALGAAMAQMHKSSQASDLRQRLNLPRLRDILWEEENHLVGAGSTLSEPNQAILSEGLGRIEAVVQNLFERETEMVIHADLHGWNAMWNDGKLSVLDFDDCGIGLPIQDIFTAVYYLDTEEQDSALFDGYRSVREVPAHTPYEREALLLQRRLVLLNYLLETSTPEHREMLPKYLEESLIRVEKFLRLSAT